MEKLMESKGFDSALCWPAFTLTLLNLCYKYVSGDLTWRVCTGLSHRWQEVTAIIMNMMWSLCGSSGKSVSSLKYYLGYTNALTWTWYYNPLISCDINNVSWKLKFTVRPILNLPVTVAELSKACTIFARSEAGIVGWNPTHGMDV
jgi:hypothetical protein